MMSPVKFHMMFPSVSGAITKWTKFFNIFILFGPFLELYKVSLKVISSKVGSEAFWIPGRVVSPTSTTKTWTDFRRKKAQQQTLRCRCWTKTFGTRYRQQGEKRSQGIEMASFGWGSWQFKQFYHCLVGLLFLWDFHMHPKRENQHFRFVQICTAAMCPPIPLWHQHVFKTIPSITICLPLGWNWIRKSTIFFSGNKTHRILSGLVYLTY